MKNARFSLRLTASLFTLALSAAVVAIAEDTKPAGGADAQMTATMTAMAQPNENHKVLAAAVGTWNYKVKWWMSPDAPPMESTGVSVTKSVMDGRYFISEDNSKMSMPGPDGKMVESNFQGMATEGYDNAKKKYVASWIDNMGTGIMAMEGTYDPATKTLTYEGEEQPMPGLKMKMRQKTTALDSDHRRMEFFMIQGDKEIKAMEITYSRAS
jgi:hypothetical protein